ncbi:MAG: hypothetical protein J07HB67_01450 [halophilic archaeon J07HB67]|nr:MAG: hypothetical protein J07HB67_01450 [halophilic archaeon J07HB67]
MAGARFGAEAIPDRWLDTLDAETELRDLATTLS